MDNTIKLISRIRDKANEFIVSELEARGHHGLAPSHGDILSVLFKLGEQTMTEISLKIGKERSTVTTLIDKLIKLGYVTTKKYEEDNRLTIVSLTNKGKELEPDFIEISEKLYNKQYNNMTEEEKNIFRILLDKMHKNF